MNSFEPARADTAAPVPTNPPVHTTSTFAALGVAPALLRALDEVGHTVPTPIQVSAIPAVIAGRDLLGCAQTGTGKTAAFALPILQRLAATPPAPAAPRRIRALILSPTRELAAQIADTFARYGKFTGLRHAVIYGGVGFGNQVNALRRGVDVLVATPGRLADLIHQREVNLDRVEVLVLDEADRMLDQGFLPEVRRMLRLIPRERQTLFFSATMPRELEPLADEILKKDPVRVAVAAVASTPDRVDQSVYLVAQEDKRGLLEHLMADASVTRAIVFTRTKHGADRVVKQLAAANLPAQAIHGNKSQNARERALGAFRGGKLRILVATDVAARGIDIGGVSHVLNYDMPVDAESYVHRIGRTARAGAGGAAISFCSPDERGRLVSVERLIKRRVAIVGDHPFARAGQRPSAPAPAPLQQRARPSGSARPAAPSRASSRTQRG